MKSLLALFLLSLSLISFSETTPSSFSSEMDFLKESSKTLNLYLPAEEVIQDEISNRQAAVKKEEKSTAIELLDEIEKEEEAIRKPMKRSRN
jgi:hypothetical protein